jgi:hypothetical protein
VAAALTARPTPLRLILGFAVAPLGVPLLWVALVVALGELPDFSDPASVRCAGFAMDLAIATGVGYGLTLLPGLPLVLGLRLAGLLSIPWTLGAGAIAGAAGAGALLLVIGPAVRRLDLLGLVSACGFGVALVVAGIFCAVAGVPLRRPRLPTAAPASSTSTASA